MQLVQLKPGCYHGKDKEHKPGDRIEVTDSEFLAFGDKFLSLGSTVTIEDTAYLTAGQGITVNPAKTEPEASGTEVDTAVSLDGLSVSDILAKVEAGEVTAQAVLEAENATGKPRKSLVAGLERYFGE